MNTRNRHTVRAATCVLGATLLCALGAAAYAGGTVGPDITVRYDDLDIDKEAGASKLLRRIEGAALRICAPLAHGTLASRIHVDTCRRQVTEAAVLKVNHPVLQATYEMARGARPRVASLGR